MITQEYLKSRLAYDPETGRFTWVLGSRKVKPGTPAGWMDEVGYWWVRIDKKLYPAHRLAWLYMNGTWPAGQVDHKNGNPADNAWGNLRDVTRRVNQENRRRANRNNKVGLLGVHKSRGRYIAKIETKGRRIRVGSFRTAEAAHAAYVEAKRKIHEGCTL